MELPLNDNLIVSFAGRFWILLIVNIRGFDSLVIRDEESPISCCSHFMYSATFHS